MVWRSSEYRLLSWWQVCICCLSCNTTWEWCWGISFLFHIWLTPRVLSLSLSLSLTTVFRNTLIHCHSCLLPRINFISVWHLMKSAFSFLRVRLPTSGSPKASVGVGGIYCGSCHFWYVALHCPFFKAVYKAISRWCFSFGLWWSEVKQNVLIHSRIHPHTYPQAATYTYICINMCMAHELVHAHICCLILFLYRSMKWIAF